MTSSLQTLVALFWWLAVLVYYATAFVFNLSFLLHITICSIHLENSVSALTIVSVMEMTRANILEASYVGNVVIRVVVGVAVEEV